MGVRPGLRKSLAGGAVREYAGAQSQKFVPKNPELWGGESCPQAGLPAGWTRWKAGPQPERPPHEEIRE